MSEETNAPLHFDFDYLNSYTSGDQPLQREVLQLFFGQIDALVANLDPDGSDKDWHAAAHAIKGSARGVGLKALGDIAEKLEGLRDEAASGRVEGLGEITAEVVEAHSAVARQYHGIFKE